MQVEYLWVPGTFVQPDGDPRLELVASAAAGHKRLVAILPVRLNASGKALTVEACTLPSDPFFLSLHSPLSLPRALTQHHAHSPSAT